jgi:ubiquinol-cytochrome c reductase cytochrome b subunit
MSFWGEYYCPIYLSINSRAHSALNQGSFAPCDLGGLPFIMPNTRSTKRIGPHDLFIFSLIFGSLLGDGYAEKHGNGTRIQFYQEASHKDYLYWLHDTVASLGYAEKKEPELKTRLGNYGKLRYYVRFSTFTFSNFDWIHDCWYKPLPFNPSSQSNDNLTPLPRSIKIVPTDISQYLTPLALAIWIMDDGGKVSSGLKLATNNFTFDEVEMLSSVLNQKYDLYARVQKAGYPNQYVIYIPKKYINNLIDIVNPFFHPSMKYKLGVP